MNIKQIVNLTSFYAKKVKNGEFKANRAKQGVKTANQTHLTPLKNNQKAGFLAKSQMQRKLNGLRGARFAEYGRSMVEMLGVLAVIGILSVTAIWGYRYAMTKYIANETINEINLRARDISFDMEAMIKNNYNGDIEMKMGPITRMGYPIRARTSPQYIDYFEIFVSNVPTDVCKELLRMPWQAPYSIFVGVEEFEASIEICEQADTVELAYEFYKDMSSKDEIDEDNRHETMRCNNENDCKCGYCENGLCKSYCSEAESCSKDVDNPTLWKCCSKENTVGSLCCISKDADGKCCNFYGQCCFDGYFANTKGDCIACNDAGDYYTFAEKYECNRCSNRTHGFNMNDKCMLNCNTLGTYTEGKPLADIDGICYSCDYSDAIDLGLWGDNSRCETLCPNRILIGRNCVLPACINSNQQMDSDGICRDKCTSEKPLRSYLGSCYSCDEFTAVDVTGVTENCSICPNRKLHGNYCMLNECPNGYFSDINGACLSCDDAGNYYTKATKEECDKCKNRTFGFNMNDKCMLNCNTPGTYTEGKPLANIDGICQSCDKVGYISLGTWGDNSRCETLCPNRSQLGISDCVINACSADKPLLDINLQCVSCDEPEALPKQINCSNACKGKRDNIGNYCVLKECQEGYFRDTSNNCKPCNDAGNYYTFATQAECAKCENRTFGFNVNDKCMLNCNTPGTYTEGKPLANIDGICYSCDYSGSISLGTWGDNSRCESLCPNRKREGLNCIRKSCSTLNILEDLSGECYPCNITIAISSTEESCSKCINRKYENGYCILP